MATVTKSIGTSSRDYSTITAWEADLDDTNIYTSGDDAVGECYNDSTFVEGSIIDGGSTVGLNSILLIPATSERHDGTADTGVKIQTLSYGGGNDRCILGSTTPTLELRYIEIERNVNAEQALVTIGNNNVFNAGIIRTSTGSANKDFVSMGFGTGYLYNSILYGVTGKGVNTQCLYGATPEIINNTIIAQSSYCLYARDKVNGQANAKIKNNILIANGTSVAVDPGGTTPTSFPDYANNITNYSSFPNGLANLSDHITDIDETQQFVSTVSGSEDYHLASTSDAIGAGEDIVATRSSTINSYYLENTQYDIDGVDRDARGAAWDIGADQAVATVVKTIGTSSRDYSTIIAWEAALDDPIYQTGDDAVGECYDDSDFSGIMTIDGGSSLSSKTLRPAVNEGHDGTSGTGVEIFNGTISVNTNEVYVNQIEINTSTYNTFVPHLRTAGNATGVGLVATRMLVHGNGLSNAGAAVGESTRRLELYNSIVYDCDAVGVSLNVFGRYARVENVTIYGCDSAGLSATDDADLNLRNIISTGNTGDDFNNTYSLGTVNNNLSSDSTASGTGSLVNKSATNQFISIVAGAEDLHLKSGSDAIGAGADLGTSIEGVQYDIDGVDRDARGLAWDIGADQAVATVVKTIGSASRDYSTFVAWEADLDSDIYQTDDDAVGEVYNDSDFTVSSTTVIDTSSGLSSITITTPLSERHDGTAGTGAKLTNTGVNHANVTFFQFADPNIRFEYMEFEFDDYYGYDGLGLWTRIGHNVTNIDINGCLFHSLENGSVSPAGGIYINSNTPDVRVHNNVFITMGYCIRSSYGGNSYFYNNTGYGSSITNRSIVGIDYVNISANVDIRSNIMANFPIDIDTGWTISPTTNATSDSSGQITGITPSDHFVSTVAGSEDLHLLETSSLIGSGQILSSEYSIDINGSNRAAFTGTAWDIGAHQYALTASIGTSSRDYSTITAWEADLDNTAKYGNGSNAVGECYNDSTFAAVGTIDGGGTVGLNSVKLTVATGEHHDGTAGTGAKIVSQANYQGVSGGNTLPVHVSLLEVDYNSFRVAAFSGNGGSGVNQYSRLLLYNGGMYNNLFYFDYYAMNIFNNTIYNFSHVTGAYAIRTTSNSTAYVFNNTVHDLRGNTNGYYLRSGGVNCKNCIASSVEGSGFVYVGTPITSNNLSSDATADDGVGTGHIINVDPVKQFISTTPGSEDLHLVMGSDALNVGADLGNTPEGVQYDIDGYDRTASITWDIGADEAHEIDGEFGYKGFLSYLNRTTLRAG